MCKCMILHFCDKNMKEQQMEWTQGFKRWVTGRCHPLTLLYTACGLSSKDNNSPTMWCIRCHMIHHSFRPLFMGHYGIFLLPMTRKKKSNKKVESVTNVRKVCVNVITSCLSLEVECVLCFQDLRNERERCHGPEGQCRKWVRPNAMQLVCECVMGPLLVQRLALDTIFPRDPKHNI